MGTAPYGIAGGEATTARYGPGLAPEPLGAPLGPNWTPPSGLEMVPVGGSLLGLGRVLVCKSSQVPVRPGTRTLEPEKPEHATNGEETELLS